ncbi:hypothetical protein OG948_13530 [Embleya sp. NBC_00888]|nr:hypothetical protein OG948_13530 [Embleya sp. NBC_00888]
MRLDSGAAGTAFGLVWVRFGRDSRLSELSPSPNHWRDEIE